MAVQLGLTVQRGLHMVTMFGNKVLRDIFGYRRDEAAWMRLSIYELFVEWMDGYIVKTVGREIDG